MQKNIEFVRPSEKYKISISRRSPVGLNHIILGRSLGMEYMWFQEDGTIPHCVNYRVEVQKKNVIVISRKSGVNWLQEHMF